MNRREQPHRITIEITATGYFHELLGAAITHQGIPASEHAQCYLVHLLADYLVAQRIAPELQDQPLGVLALQAAQADLARRLQILRHLGDYSLFMTGFFADYLARKRISRQYYREIGEGAYASLAALMDRAFRDTPSSSVYAEMAEKFPLFISLFREVADECAVAGVTDLVQLYQMWLKTGSRCCASKLREQGILPSASTPRKLH